MSFSESGNAILSYERNKWSWFKRIPHSSIERHCVDVWEYTIRANLDVVDQSILLYVVITIFHFERRLHSVGAVCSAEKTEIKLKGQETSPLSTYLDVFTADRVSDLLTNSFWLEFKNFKIVEEETKNGRENTDMNKRTINLDWSRINIWLIFLSRWVRLSSYSLDDSLFRNTLFMFGRNVLNIKKMKITR